MGIGRGSRDIVQGRCPEQEPVPGVERGVVATFINAKPVLAEARLREGHRVERKIGEIGACMTGSATPPSIEQDAACKLCIRDRAIFENKALEGGRAHPEFVANELRQRVCDL